MCWQFCGLFLLIRLDGDHAESGAGKYEIVRAEPYWNENSASGMQSELNQLQVQLLIKFVTILQWDTQQRIEYITPFLSHKNL